MRGTLIKARSTDRRSFRPLYIYIMSFDPTIFSHFQCPVFMLRILGSYSFHGLFRFLKVRATALCRILHNSTFLRHKNIPTVEAVLPTLPLGNASILCLAKRRNWKRSWQRSKRNSTTGMTAWRLWYWLFGLPEGV